ETIEVVLKNWRAEVETAQVYRDLAARESDEKRKGILMRMAEAEERHARRWEQKLRDMGEPVPTLTDTSGLALNADSRVHLEPTSRFVEWKRRRKNMSANFPRSATALSRPSTMCRNS